MDLDQPFDAITRDLPWVERVRLAVGPLSSREAVKDELLRRVEVIPSWAVGTLGEIAAAHAAAAGRPLGRSLGAASQCDAVQRLAEHPLVRQAAPALCLQLKDRSVARKVAAFISQLDRFHVTESDLDALIEAAEARNSQVCAVARAVAAVWAKGELLPWGEGSALREAVRVLDEGRREGAPASVWVWGYAEFAPAEEAYLERLAAGGTEVRVIAPEPGETRARPVVSAWEPHSVWDEFEFLRDALEGLRSEGTAWADVVVYVPDDALYKRLARQRLSEWNVPIHDPTLPGAWKDRADWLWWLDLMKAVAGGLRLDDVRAWLGRGPGRGELYERAYLRGLHGGARQWQGLAGNIPELRLAVEAARVLGRSLGPLELREALGKLAPLSEVDAGILKEFGDHLVEQRPFLEGTRARLPRYVPLFEEFLEAKGRTESARSPDGLRLCGHGVWLPRPARHAFILGANLLKRALPRYDPWEWEVQDVRRAWERVHAGAPVRERGEREEALLRTSSEDPPAGTYSACAHDATARPLAASPICERFRGGTAATRAGGHPAVGWTISPVRPSWEQGTAPEIHRPDLAPEGSVRVGQFEDYLRCPFIYYARHVLKLDPEHEIGLDPGAAARGDILHRVLERFVREEIDGRPFGTAPAALARVRDLVSEEVARKGLPGMYRHQPLVERAVAMLRTELERWVEWEAERRRMFPRLLPRAVELPLEIHVGGLLLRGRADRVDSDGVHCTVIDYKSGSSVLGGKELLAGVGAQLLAYARAVQLSTGLEPAAAYYLQIGRAVASNQGVFLKEHNGRLFKVGRVGGLADGKFGDAYDSVQPVWEDAAARLRRGEFTPRPARGKKECASCRFQTVCGHAAAAPDPDEGDGE